MSTEPMDIYPPLVEGLSHISLVASSADLFYSTVQFYENLGFQSVSLVLSLKAIVADKSLIVRNRARMDEMMIFVPIPRRRLGCIVMEREMGMMLLLKSD